MASGPKDADNGMLMEEVDLKIRHKYERSWITGERIALLGLIAVGVVLVIVGIVLLAMASSAAKKCSNGELNNGEGSGPTSSPSYKTFKRCEFSAEAKRIGLDEFINRVKETYYTLHPFSVPFHPDIHDSLESFERVKREYVAYDPTPSVIKNRTDISWALLKEIKSKEVNMNALKPRERKSLAQVKHYLQHMFGQPYDVNYYAGDWMMGPNLFCWQPICYHGYDFYNGMIYHKPFNANDVEHIRKKLETHKVGILQYIENMKMGIRKGMVRSVEECIAGVDSVKRRYLNVSLYNETGKGFYLEEFAC